MPPKEMKPTMLAIVKFWPVSSMATTDPINAIGIATMTCNAKLMLRNIVNNVRNTPSSATMNKPAIALDALRWLSN